MLTNNYKDNIELKTISLDFEDGLINAIHDSFPNVRIIDCFFH